MQIKTIMRCHLTPSTGEDVEKSEPFYSIGGNVKQRSRYGKQYGGSSKKLKIELPYHPASPLWDIYPKELKSRSQDSSLMLIAALCTIAKMWERTICPSTYEWINKMQYTCAMDYSALKRNEIPTHATI